VTDTLHTTGPTPGVAATTVEAVVTHHRDGFRSGVARFNELLAEHLGVPLLGIRDAELARTRATLFSFKVGELPKDDVEYVAALVKQTDWHGELYLHDWADLPLEETLARRARRIHCGNLEIQARVNRLNPSTLSVWTPGLILDQRTYAAAEISVFSFGMAHKIRTDMFRRLRDLLDASEASYAVYVSAATSSEISPTSPSATSSAARRSSRRSSPAACARTTRRSPRRLSSEPSSSQISTSTRRRSSGIWRTSSTSTAATRFRSIRSSCDG
jgi:hypothetical protein